MKLPKTNISSQAVAVVGLTVIAGSFLIGCDSSNSVTEGEQGQVLNDEFMNGEVVSDGFVAGEFDGTWRASCFENRTFMAPDDAQPINYFQTTLELDSNTNTFSTVTLFYGDQDCGVLDPEATTRRSGGEITSDGLVITSSGLEATVVRYMSNSGIPDQIGLLYRDGDVLFRNISSNLIEPIVPTTLALGNPWQLVN